MSDKPRGIYCDLCLCETWMWFLDLLIDCCWMSRLLLLLLPIIVSSYRFSVTKLLLWCCRVAANVVKALQTFWTKKLSRENAAGVLSYADEGLICYAVEPVTDPPFTCYVTLPNGCCFGNLLSVSLHQFLYNYCRVRTILALGNWVLGNICRYWVVLPLGDIFFIVTPNTIPIRQQSAPSTW